jgi:hypothetical protein
MNLANYVSGKFDGMLIVGDIHSDYISFKRAHDYAKSENFFFMSLGDLVDRDQFPFETVEAMHKIMYAGAGGFTIGNHDDKYRRFYKGAKVQISADAHRTLKLVGEERKDEFLKMYSEIVEDQILSAMFHKFGDITIVHAASHPCMWETVERFGDTARSRALYGETNGETHSDGYPVRLYNWIDEIPMGKIVVVGHDRMPIHNVPIESPLTKTNANGGKAIFLDTGCGKGGFLSGMIILFEKGRFKIDSYKEFK